MRLQATLFHRPQAGRLLKAPRRLLITQMDPPPLIRHTHMPIPATPPTITHTIPIIMGGAGRISDSILDMAMGIAVITAVITLILATTAIPDGTALQPGMATQDGTALQPGTAVQDGMARDGTALHGILLTTPPRRAGAWEG